MQSEDYSQAVQYIIDYSLFMNNGGCEGMWTWTENDQELWESIQQQRRIDNSRDSKLNVNAKPFIPQSPPPGDDFKIPRMRRRRRGHGNGKGS